MFSKLSNLFSTGMEALLSDRTIPISEEVINSALSTFMADIPEISALSVDIQDGYFDLLAEGKKILTLKSRTRFEITSCEISAGKQTVTFRRVSPTELSADKYIDRILILLFKAIACRIFQIEPAKFVLEGVPGITINGDGYTVDLSQTDIAGNITPKIEGILKVAGSLMKVKSLKCAPKTLQMVIGRQ